MADPSLLARGVHHAVDGDATSGMFIRMADTIRFTLNGRPVEVAGLSPMTTLLDWLRDHRGLRGTKEGCAEGDCGACTIVLERSDGRHEAINSCIAMLGQMDGQSIRTAEGLLGTDGVPHPVQCVFAESDATQCGFCTPGFVMTAYAFAAGGDPPGFASFTVPWAGISCRSTATGPIADAWRRVTGPAPNPAQGRRSAPPRP